MGLGPIVRKELFLASRRRATFVGRVSTLLILVAVAGGIEAYATNVLMLDRTSIVVQRGLSLVTIEALFGVLMGLAAFVPSAEVAPGIAQERDKKSLDALLTTELSGFEIVVGKLLAGLLNHAVGVFTTVPVLFGLAYLWGVPTWFVALAYLGIASCALVTGSFAIWVSAHSRNPRKAVGYAILVGLAFFYFPFLFGMLLPMISTRFGGWIGRLGWGLMETGPFALMLHAVGFRQKGTIQETAGRMIAIQLVVTALVVAWTSVRCRAICRSAEEREGRRWLRKARKLVAVTRPPCGDDPILWYEKYSTRGVGPFMRRWGQFVSLAMLLALGWFIGLFAVPAFAELFQRGYGVGQAGINVPEFNPFVRVLIGIKMPATAQAPLGLARWELNTVIRWLTAIFSFMNVIVSVSYASEAIVTERSKDTLSGLLATPLSGPEILRAKALGTLWRLRLWILLPLALWTLGLVAGAVHPLGFLAAVIGLALTIWCCVAIGLFGSIWAEDLKSVSANVAFPALMVVFSGLLPLLLPSALTSVYFGMLSPGWHTFVSLFSYEDIRDALESLPYTPLGNVNVHSNEGIGPVLASLLIGWTLIGATAAYFTRAAVRQFDRAVGRPIRSESGPIANEVTPLAPRPSPLVVPEL